MALELVDVADAAAVEQARELFAEYAAAIGVDLDYQGFPAELAALPVPYQPPRGALLIARDAGGAAGCVALRPLEHACAEMKRLYVRDAWRGSGLGRRLVDAAVARARALGYTELRLDTLPDMAAAQRLYRRLGFREIAAYNTTHLPGTRFYALRLRD